MKEAQESRRRAKNIYTAPTAAATKFALIQLREIYDERFPAVGKSLEADWDN